MKGLTINIAEGDAGQPLIIEVSVELENMVWHGLKQLGISAGKVSVERTQPDHGLPFLHFICLDFPKERLPEFYWHAGDWYVRHHELLSQHLN